MSANVDQTFRQILAGICPAITPEQRLRSIVNAYDDRPAEAKIPTILALMIEAAREHCGQGTQAAYKEDLRTASRPDHDLDTCGRQLKPGT